MISIESSCFLPPPRWHLCLADSSCLVSNPNCKWLYLLSWAPCRELVLDSKAAGKFPFRDISPSTGYHYNIFFGRGQILGYDLVRFLEMGKVKTVLLLSNAAWLPCQNRINGCTFSEKRKSGRWRRVKNIQDDTWLGNYIFMEAFLLL